MALKDLVASTLFDLKVDPEVVKARFKRAAYPDYPTAEDIRNVFSAHAIFLEIPSAKIAQYATFVRELWTATKDYQTRFQRIATEWARRGLDTGLLDKLRDEMFPGSNPDIGK